ADKYPCLFLEDEKVLTAGKIVYIITPREKEAFFIVIHNMKNLLSKSLSKKKLAIISASFIVFIAAIGFITYETTKKSVALTIDGQEKIITTHATTIQDIFDDLEISLRSEDYVFPSVNTKVKNNLEIVYKPAKQVHIVKDNEKKTIWTVAKTVEEFLEDQK